MKEFYFVQDDSTYKLAHVTKRLYNDVRERKVEAEETKFNRCYINNTVVVRCLQDGTVWFDIQCGNTNSHILESLYHLTDNRDPDNPYANLWGEPDDYKE